MKGLRDDRITIELDKVLISLNKARFTSESQKEYDRDRAKDVREVNKGVIQAVVADVMHKNQVLNEKVFENKVKLIEN